MVGGKGKLTATRIAFKQEAASFRGSFRKNEGLPLKEVLARAIVGGLLAVSVALAARRTRTLSTTGAITAAVVGTLSVAAGWSWGALLLTFFVTATALSSLGQLIRDPRAMLASLNAKMGMPSLRDTGLEQQVEIFRLTRSGTWREPPVIDSADVLRDPRGVRSSLCQAVGVEFLDSMLSWPPGRRDTDGVWAKYWYDAVERSTGFEAPRQQEIVLAPELEALAQECQPFYDELAQYKLT